MADYPRNGNWLTDDPSSPKLATARSSSFDSVGLAPEAIAVRVSYLTGSRVLARYLYMQSSTCICNNPEGQDNEAFHRSRQ
jgi:hypothetical protein